MNEKKLVRKTEDFCNAVNEMNSAMEKTTEREAEKTSKITEFKKKFPDALYIVPRTRIPTQGTRIPELDKQKDYLNEYVVGIFESQIISGELDFFLDGLPGDDYCRWTIPINKAIGIPRHVAKHLSQNLGWKEMKPLGKDNMPKDYFPGEEGVPFQQFEYKKRGHFHPINAY